MSLSSAVDGGDEDDGDSVGWRLFRNMSEETRQLCDAWGDLKGSSCVTMDSGVYWCESTETGASSMVINLTVTDQAVILQGPSVPVTEGSAIRLCCTTRTQACNRDAVLYKDNTILRSQQPDVTGLIIIQNMFKSNEGFYRCVINGTENPNTPPLHFFTVLVLAIVGALVLVVLLIFLVCCWFAAQKYQRDLRKNLRSNKRNIYSTRKY
ncbi:uncharacterized protein LOC103390056 [Cynoglossus semilaevis]|uniref:uncharacterized protein LOC103390056 n=1 Tax=Cynoglossus semilaevis TaxID=244447 RepID=UPI0004978394|nr:uncharacterized protein LOC103390056 [Cynoglossus semilaevis]